MAAPSAKEIEQKIPILKSQLDEENEKIQRQINELNFLIEGETNDSKAEELRETIQSLEEEKKKIRKYLKKLSKVPLTEIAKIDSMNQWLNESVQASSLGSTSERKGKEGIELSSEGGGFDQSGERDSDLGEDMLLSISDSEKTQESSKKFEKAGSDVSEMLTEGSLSSSSVSLEHEVLVGDEKPKRGMMDRIQDSSSNDPDEVEDSDNVEALIDAESNIPGLVEKMKRLARESKKGVVGSGEDCVKLTNDNVMMKGVIFEESSSDSTDPGLSFNLKGKMVAWICECEKELQEGKLCEKKNLMQLLKECNKPDSDRQAFKELMAEAVKKGIGLSNLLVDFVFLVAESEESSLPNLGLLYSTLGSWLYNNGDCVVVSKIVDILGMSIHCVRGLKKVESQKGSSATNKTEELILQFLGEMLQLELILSHQRLSDSKKLIQEELSLLEADFRKFEAELEGIASTVDAWKASSPGLATEPENQIANEYWRLATELKKNVTETWNKLESEESEDQTRD